ncbi:VOC family protein [Opitutus terrae]|uniref:Glyoxalase/bleomycin resistance protein/dioxygenase n=1 Tax=Opitutus terrae (strain DSM 11246 / JCM 15787 / PB90-1) TaxID=452637 RepID=B1ZU51_OPITP|nr:VOC family protein [Opitutus terrae]ACB76617.1 Glyoxalase/bleomycin resistance protein/dioxygenase [Opitutus terrae PB90-1]
MSITTLSSAATQSAVKPVPEDMHTVTPHLVCAGAAAAIEFYKKAFAAVEVTRVPGPEGKLIHGSVRIGNSLVILADEFPDWGSTSPKTLEGTSVTIHLSVENADRVAETAVQAGAKIIIPVADAFWGDRYGVLEDPFGHRWSVGTHVRDVSPEDIQKAATELCG